MLCAYFGVFFFKQKTAYEMRISDWSSDVCSSDLAAGQAMVEQVECRQGGRRRTTEFKHRPRGLREFAQLSPAVDQGALRYHDAVQIGRASGRERVCPYV